MTIQSLTVTRRDPVSGANIGAIAGPPGASARVGTVTTGAPGTEAAVTITGTPPSQAFNFVIPAGATGAPGAPGAAGANGTNGAAGAPGPANSLAIGTVTTGAPGSAAAASITGTAPSQTLNLTIPAGTGGSAPSNAATIGFTAVNDANHTILATDRWVAYATLTAPRVATLPAASAYPVGQPLVISDNSGACSTTNTITIAASGSDTILGQAMLVIEAADGLITLYSNGTNLWQAR